MIFKYTEGRVGGISDAICAIAVVLPFPRTGVYAYY